MTRKQILIAAVMLFAVTLISSPLWAAPGRINYQGKITDQSGAPLEGSYTMKFHIYAGECGGTPLWNEEKVVTMRNGVFDVQLGSDTPLSPDLFTNDTLFLGIDVFNPGIGWESFYGCQPFTSTAFAMKAGDANTVDGHHASDFVGTGQTESITSDMIGDGQIGSNDMEDGAALSEILGNDGTGSELDTDFLDGKDSTDFLDTSYNSQTKAGGLAIEGHLVIGTINPWARLTVWSDCPSMDFVEFANKGDGGQALILQSLANDSPYVDPYLGFSTWATNWKVGVDISENNKFKIAYSALGSDDRITIDNGGNVGIGTTSPSQKLHIMGNVQADSYLYNSDTRLKKNITPIDNALEKVSALKGVEFEWRADEYPERGFAEGRKIGLIAQEVEEVLPEVVSADNEGYKSVEYGNLVGVLVEAIKAQQAQIQAQQSQIEELKARLEALER